MNLFKAPYKYVPPCPKCKSKKTGYFIFNVMMPRNPSREMAKALSRGEIVRFIVGFDTYDNSNVFCSECGLQWRAKIEDIPYSKERVMQECKDRGITMTEILKMENYKQNIRKQKNEEKKENKKRKQAMKHRRRQRRKQEVVEEQNNDILVLPTKSKVAVKEDVADKTNEPTQKKNNAQKEKKQKDIKSIWD